MDSKERILKMLEEGKITSEEAIRLMETMDKKEKNSASDSSEETGNKKPVSYTHLTLPTTPYV